MPCVHISHVPRRSLDDMRAVTDAVGADPGAYLDALEATPGQPPQVEGGSPHFTAGMYHEVTVR